MVEIPLTKGASALIDKESVEKVRAVKWYLSSNGYAVNKGGLEEGAVYMHRLIIDCPEGLLVDHINGNKLDNRVSNLRVVTVAQNQMNRRTVRKNTSSIYKGVSKNKRNGKWRSYIKYSGKYVSLGEFHAEIDAALAYDAAAIQYFGEYAATNFNATNAEP